MKNDRVAFFTLNKDELKVYDLHKYAAFKKKAIGYTSDLELRLVETINPKKKNYKG